MSQCGKVATNTGSKTYDLCGHDRLNQHCVNSFSKGLKVTDVSRPMLVSLLSPGGNSLSQNCTEADKTFNISVSSDGLLNVDSKSRTQHFLLVEYIQKIRPCVQEITEWKATRNHLIRLLH